MLARRDYAAAWRDGYMTLAQVPVAGLLAGNYIFGQWVDRSQDYLTHVTSRLALARPAAARGGRSTDIMTEVVSDDLVEATRAFVLNVVSMPAATAKFFTTRLEGMVKAVLTEVQPDAQTDVRSYVANELSSLDRNISRLREVVAAETTRESQATGRRGARSTRARSDRRALERLLAQIRRLARQGGPRRHGGVPRERMLEIFHDILEAAVTRFPAATPQPVRRGSAAERRVRQLLERDDARRKPADAQATLARLRRPAKVSPKRRKRR